MTRAVLAVVAAAGAGALSVPAAQAAAPSGSLTPYVSCYWQNTDGSFTFSVGVTSTNSATVTVPVGADNHITVGAADRGQPTTFAPGSHNNVWAPTATWTDINSGINWYLAGKTVQFASWTECATKPVPANGNPLAYLAFGGLALLVGAVTFGGARLRRSVTTAAVDTEAPGTRTG